MSTELVAAPRIEVTAALERVQVEEKLFELAQRKASVYAKSSLVPKEYQNNIGNVLIAENMARRMGADTLMVMQNLYIVHNRPGWSAQFLIATFNSNGRFTAIKYEFSGTPGKDDWGCVAFAKEIATEEIIRGTKITLDMAKKEGWVNKNGSKWQTMPEQMMRYRAATFLIRATAPEIGMGLMTKEELDDIVIDELPRSPKPSLDELADKMLGNNGASEPADEPLESADSLTVSNDPYDRFLVDLHATKLIGDAQEVRANAKLPEDQLVDADEALVKHCESIRAARVAGSNK